MPLIELSDRHNFQDYPLLNKAQLNDLNQLEEFHFWYQARNRFIFDFLKHCRLTQALGPLLDVGCGTGAVLSYLQGRGLNFQGVDTCRQLLALASTRQPSIPFYLGKTDDLGAEFQGKYCALTYFDVLEHLEHPLQQLRKDLRLLAQGGQVVLTVPGSPSLWGRIDALSGHKKRYQLQEVKQMLRHAGLKNIQVYSYMNGLFPFLLLQRFFLDLERNTDDDELLRRNMKLPPAPINKMFSLLLNIERKMFFPRLRFLPTSIIACASY